MLGSPERIEYHAYETPKDFDAVRNQQDDIYFLTGSEIEGQKPAGKVLPGPTVFVESHAVMAPVNSAAQHVDDLAGNSICFMIGSPVERTLNAYFYTLHKNWFRLGFTEDGEMNDAYNAQSCHAVAGEITYIKTEDAIAQLKKFIENLADGLAQSILPDSLIPVRASH